MQSTAVNLHCASFSKKGTVSSWIRVCWLVELRCNHVVFLGENKCDSVYLTHMCLSEDLKAAGRDLWSMATCPMAASSFQVGTGKSSALKQLRLCSAPVPQGRTEIQPGGGLGSWFLTISAGLQSLAPLRESKLKTASSLGEWPVKAYRTVQSKALPHSVLCRYCTLEHMLLGDKEDRIYFQA